MTSAQAIRKFAAQVINTDGLEIGDPVILEAITFVPIIKQVLPREERDYLTLSEALNEGACKIFDMGTQVNHILFQNLSEFPILIEEGEIFLGQGTQDRICVGTIMVAPGEEVKIPVKCVHAPHSLRSGAAFGYGGKCSRSMLSELRSLKGHHAVQGTPVSTISQTHVWDTVADETLSEADINDRTKYTETVQKRRARAKKRSDSLKFPENTVGLIVINPDGEIKGVEIHRSPHNFQVRKDGILESLETNVSWEKNKKGPYKSPKEPVKKLFTQLSKIEEEKDALKQIEVDGLVLNMDGVTGEALSSEFYSGVCPKCGRKKPRKKVCPECGFEEEASEEMTFFSLA